MCVTLGHLPTHCGSNIGCNMNIKRKAAAAAAAIILSAISTQAAAATINFSDPVPTGLNLSGSYTLNNTACPGPSTPALDKPCAALNTLTITADTGYTFDLNSFYYKLSAAAGDAISVTFGLPAGSFNVTDNSNEALWTGSIKGLSFVTFSGATTGNSNPLIDNIDVTVSAVPVPAAGLLLFGAFGGLAALRRKRKAA